MSTNFLVFILYSLYSCGEATRFLPMIVWDHINPQLNCKSNWLNIPKIDVYDRVDFVCPSLRVAVTLLDGYSRPTAEMNENIFMRKWTKTNLTELKIGLENGSFCDPEKSVKLHTCRDGNEGQSLPVSFTPDNGDSTKNYVLGDVVVYFNNGNDGRSATLNDNTARCSMVLVVNITWLVQVVHDFSYGKCLNPHADICNKIDANSSKCGYVDETTVVVSTTPTSGPNVTTLSPANNTTSLPNTTSSTVETTTTATTTTESPTTLTTTNPNQSQQQGCSSKPEEHNFFKGFLAGFFCMTFIAGAATFVYFIYQRNKPKKSPKPKFHPPNTITDSSQQLRINGLNGATPNQGFTESPVRDGGDMYGVRDSGLPNGNDNPGYRISVVNPHYRQNPNNNFPPNYNQATKEVREDSEV